MLCLSRWRRSSCLPSSVSSCGYSSSGTSVCKRRASSTTSEGEIKSTGDDAPGSTSVFDVGDGAGFGASGSSPCIEGKKWSFTRLKRPFFLGWGMFSISVSVEINSSSVSGAGLSGTSATPACASFAIGSASATAFFFFLRTFRTFFSGAPSSFWSCSSEYSFSLLSPVKIPRREN